MKITLTRVNIKSALGRVYMNPLCPRLTWLAAMLALACAAETGHAQSAGDVRRVSLQRQPLSQVMKQLAQTRHISLHYANSLAERPVGGDCPADPLPELITCLLGQAQNVIVRLSPGGKPAELWLISSGEPPGKFTSIEPEMSAEDTENTLENQRIEDAMQEKMLHNLAHGQAADKLAAMSAMIGRELNDPKQVNQLLKEALHDRDPDVRGKSIAVLSQLDHADAEPYLRQMLNDPDSAVRLATVLAADNFPEVLQSALNDADSQVRDYAQLSISRLNPPAASSLDNTP